ncbi:hypothetical protein HK414_01260 [Ramlibacter terrae]|uniref:Uncharacterized protein n=1 Tax=Ramlibacter terrae TaxID=2732511 RepID=A0ABX6NZX9_9BURK|nr:hypothetical protein HK414_01260 [Ramlibacter terrae]
MQASRDGLRAESAELSGVKLSGPLVLPEGCKSERPAAAWSLAPLAAAEGTLRAKILDAHLIFDADVTVPIRQGRIDFKDATVEHVGPDSRMGASRLGLYVDAPNGRSYLYQFPTSLVPGVEYEKRGALLGPGSRTAAGCTCSLSRNGCCARAGAGRRWPSPSRRAACSTAPPFQGTCNSGKGSWRRPASRLCWAPATRCGCTPKPSAARSRWRCPRSRCAKQRRKSSACGSPAKR